MCKSFIGCDQMNLVGGEYDLDCLGVGDIPGSLCLRNMRVGIRKVRTRMSADRYWFNRVFIGCTIR
jgi:hypothetical protein